MECAISGLDTHGDTPQPDDETSAIWVIAAAGQLGEPLSEALTALAGAPAIRVVEDTKTLAARPPSSAPALCCVVAPDAVAGDRAASDLACVVDVAGGAPVVLVGDAALADTALAAGAWDVLDSARPEALAARLARAFDAGRARREITRLHARLNACPDVGPGRTDPARAPSEHEDTSSLDGRLALHRALARDLAADRVSGLLLVAIDEIDVLQTEYGVAGADRLLLEATLFVLESLDGSDRCFRFAAGETAIIVERDSREQVVATAEYLHSVFDGEDFGSGDDGGQPVRLTASVAASVLAGDAAARDAQLKRVMERAYALRLAGGDACDDCTQSGHAENAPAEADDWASKLRQALADNRFSLAYQGITSLAGDSQPYFDVLVRYIDDGGALVRPGLFLAAAEQTGLMPEIDRWVTRRAVDVIAQQSAQGRQVSLFIKLSAATIGAGGEFLHWLQDAIPGDDATRHGVIFCLREQDARSQSRAARTLAAELQALKFRIALTHFGGSAQAAQMLDDLPAAFVKLSPDFAKQLATGADERLDNIVAATRDRQIPLIAEQIEDANSMAHLWQAGVNYVQGHFIQEPDTEALAHGALTQGDSGML